MPHVLFTNSFYSSPILVQAQESVPRVNLYGVVAVLKDELILISARAVLNMCATWRGLLAHGV